HRAPLRLQLRHLGNSFEIREARLLHGAPWKVKPWGLPDARALPAGPLGAPPEAGWPAGADAPVGRGAWLEPPPAWPPPPAPSRATPSAAAPSGDWAPGS